MLHSRLRSRLGVALGLLWACCSLKAATSEAYQTIDLSQLSSSRVCAGTTASNVPSAYDKRGPIHAFDGSGLTGDAHVATVANDTMYMSSSNNTGSFPWYIQVDLGAVTRLDALRIWNFNFQNYTSRGISDYKLYVSTAGTWETSAAAIASSYTLVKEGRLARATGKDDDTGELVELDHPVAARFVALVALDDFDAKQNLNYNGVSEIRLLQKEATMPVARPEAPLSICCVGDSITEGARYVGAANKWTYRLYLPDLLAAKGFTDIAWKGSHVSSASGTDLPSEGWSGENAKQVADRYVANAETDRADYLLLHAGHNYDATAASEAQIIANVTNAHARIIAAARQQNPQVTILEAQVITSAKLPKYSYIPALNRAIAVLANDLTTEASPIHVVDMADGWDPETMCVSDKVHPTEAGARRMAKIWCEALLGTMPALEEGVLVEAESFETKGGWVVDPQVAEVMGSPYLLAHGCGKPVADAKTTVAFNSAGRVRAWVRTRDWTPDWEGEKPGRFKLALGGLEFPSVLGVAPANWDWVDAGVIDIEPGRLELSLKDLTGFEGRCDAIYLVDEKAPAPPSDPESLAAWRAQKLGESVEPPETITADLVVVGGGMTGTAAAVAAADAGLSVAIVQDRPMLGGNASDEIRVETQRKGSEFHWIVKALQNHVPNGQPMAADDEARHQFVASYPSITPHLGWRAYGVVTNVERKIIAVDARHVETGARRRFVAPLFVDTTGDGWLGYWAGAAFNMGREAKGDFGEPQYAQDVADTCTMGNSLLWTTKRADAAYEFPSVPWATKVSGNRANTSGDWTWEAGLGPDENTIYDAEMLRDRVFRAIYGSFSNAKAKAGNENLVFDWVPYLAGRRESRRIIGDYVVRERDVTETRQFEDAIGIATWSIDLHFYSGNSGFIAATDHKYYPAWWMPYRSLCCRDVPNLFMAGRCASYTHVAFGSSRVMNAGAQQGVAVGYAASLCKKYACRPREIYCDAAKTRELQALINKRNEYKFPVSKPVYEEGVSVIVDNADATGVEISGTWATSSYNSARYGADYLHNDTKADENLWVRYTPVIPSKATYAVSLFWNGSHTRSTKVPVEIVYDGGVVTNEVDMTVESPTWNVIGSWPFATDKPASVRILTRGQSGKTVIADAVKFAVVKRAGTEEDLDGNGLPNAWERRHFLQETGTDPNGDPDGDGFTNLEEYQRGTNPNRVNLPLTVTISKQ